MYATARNNLLKLFTRLRDAGEVKPDFSDWAIVETLQPSGLWNAFRKHGGRDPSANHFQALLRKLIPHLVENGWLSRSLAPNALSIPKLVIPPRNPRIPSPAEMEALLVARETETGNSGNCCVSMPAVAPGKGRRSDRSRSSSGRISTSGTTTS